MNPCLEAVGRLRRCRRRLPTLPRGVFLAAILSWVGVGAAPPTKPPDPAPLCRYRSAFGIDYDAPEKYRAQGEQTRLPDPSVVDSLRGATPGMAQLGAIHFWIKRQFTTWSAGGQTIGAVTTEQLLKERRLGGCHDWGLVYATLARQLGYPAIVVDGAGIAWAKGVRAGRKGPYRGHVFVEVFVSGQWVLVDPANNWYVQGKYDPANPVIPLPIGEETEGMFALRKGTDTWGYGIRSNAELRRLMEETAKRVDFEQLVVPSYHFQRW